MPFHSHSTHTCTCARFLHTGDEVAYAVVHRESERTSKPLWQESCRVQEDRADVADSHATIPDAHTSVEAAEAAGGPDTERPCRGLEPYKASKEEDRLGWRPQSRDLLLEPYLAHLRAESSARGGIEAGGPGTPGMRASARLEEAGSDCSQTAACWRKCRVGPQVAVCTEGSGATRAEGCIEQGQQQKPGLTARTRKQACCPYNTREAVATGKRYP